MHCEVVRAAQVLSRKVGALIVLERQTGLKEVEETGIPLMLVSAEVLVNMLCPTHRSMTERSLSATIALQLLVALPLTESVSQNWEGTGGLGHQRTVDCVTVVSRDRHYLFHL